MPTVISVEYEKTWDTNYLTTTYSDRSRKIIEIEEGAVKGEEKIEREVEGI